MTFALNQEESSGVEPRAPDPRPDERKSRRSFLAAAGKKAAFVAPVVLSLTAQPVFAASGSCSPYGAACEVNDDCCTLNCHQLTMTCKGAI